MVLSSFKKQSNSIKQRFIDRKRLLKPFVKQYGYPVLVHAVDNEVFFKKILQEGKLKIPKEHSSRKKTPLMEQVLKIDNGIYYSVGFVYLTAYDWKYNLIFDVRNLRNLIYYSGSVNFACYKAIVDYWYNKDKSYLEKLANKNKFCREVVDKYYNFELRGKKRMMFEYWKIEKCVFDAIQKYSNKKELDKIIASIEKSRFKPFPASMADAKKSYLTTRVPEVIGLKENNLLTNKHFLGFYIKDDVPKDLLIILKKKYSDKIIFDGVKIKNISEL